MSPWGRPRLRPCALGSAGGASCDAAAPGIVRTAPGDGPALCKASYRTGFHNRDGQGQCTRSNVRQRWVAHLLVQKARRGGHLRKHGCRTGKGGRVALGNGQRHVGRRRDLGLCPARAAGICLMRGEACMGMLPSDHRQSWLPTAGCASLSNVLAVDRALLAGL